MRSMIQPLSISGVTSAVATLRPLRKIVIAFEILRISSRKCEMKMMLRPPSRSFARTPNKRSISGGDKAEGGSSRGMRGALGHPSPRDNAHPVHGLAAQKNILGDRQFRRDTQLLMHHADAGGERVAGGTEMNLLPVDAHRSRIGPMNAGDDLHHRAFAGAVLACEARG